MVLIINIVEVNSLKVNNYNTQNLTNTCNVILNVTMWTKRTKNHRLYTHSDTVVTVTHSHRH